MESREWEKRLTKEQLFADLEDCIRIMNYENFGLSKQERLAKQATRELKAKKDSEDRRKGRTPTPAKSSKSELIRHGNEMVRAILKLYKITTLCKLSKRQLEDVIDYIHMSVMKG